jgi:hypothetical protein
MSRRSPGLLTRVLMETLKEDREVTIGDIVDHIASRGFGFLLVILALPTLIPILPPGSATLIGLVYVLLALQMLWGAQRPWLPRRIRAYRLSRQVIVKFRQIGVKTFERIERVSRARATFLPDLIMARVIAVAVLLHGFVLLSPMPFLHTLPAIAVMILGVGLLNHDGLLLATGLMLSVGVLTIVVSSAGVLYSTRTMPVLLTAALLMTFPGGIVPGQVTIPGSIPPGEVKSQVDVDASADQVWAVLTDFSSYPIWNPFIYPLKGELRSGSQLEVTIHPAGTQTITYQATVIAVNRARELTWSGQIFSGGVFETTYSFTIEPLESGRARLVSHESHKGFAVVLAWRLMKDVQAGLATMIRAVRTRAELQRLVHR